MRIFISWSGEKSRKVAEKFKTYLEMLHSRFKPFVSSDDIQSGSVWIKALHNELEKSNCGILCLTKENYAEPWLLYEAGALSKLGKSRVVPFLFDVEESVIPDPLRQLQSVSLDKDEIRKMVLAFGNLCRDNEPGWKERFTTLFNNLYDEHLEKPLKELLAQEHDSAPRQDAPDSAELQMLRESLEVARKNTANIQQILQKQNRQSREIAALREEVRELEARFGASPRRPDAPPIPPGLQRETENFCSILSNLKDVAKNAFYNKGMAVAGMLLCRNFTRTDKQAALNELGVTLNKRLENLKNMNPPISPDAKKARDTIPALLKSIAVIKRELDML